MITVDDNAIASMLSEAVGPSTIKFYKKKKKILVIMKLDVISSDKLGTTVKKLHIISLVDLLSNTYHYTPAP